MDYSRSQDDPMGFGYSSSNPNPNPNRNPNPNPPPITIRPSSAFSKPMNNIPSSSSTSALLSPRDHHHHHHPHHHHHRNGTSASSDQFGTPAADPVPMVASPSSTPIINSLCPPRSTSAAALAALSTMIKYRECLRNHAASIGGHVLDGCCEFMPGDADPLKCAACDCHRSFHRKLTEGAGDYSRSIRDHHDHRVVSSVPLLLPPPHPVAALHNHHQSSSSHHQKHFASTAAIPPVPSAPPPHVLAFGGGTIANATIANSNNNNNNSGSGATTESSSEERMDASTAQAAMNMIVSKKRFRTKFTAEQKEKMMGFAERVGWRIQRQDEATVEEFCKDVGVKRQVLKVWMHNNKHSTREQQQQMRQQTQLGSAEAPPPPPPPPLQQQQAAAAPAPAPSPSPAIFGHMRN